MQTELVRAKTFNIRFSEEEERLELVAAHYAITAAGAIRMLIKREADAISAAKVATPPPAPSSKPRPKKR